MKLSGYAARFNEPATIAGAFVEVVMPGAFAATLKDGRNKHLLYHHTALSSALVLATTANNTLTLREDSQGLYFEAELPDTQAARDVHALVKRGDLSQMSFGFLVAGTKGEHWDDRGKLPRRELRALFLHEVSVVPSPAYAGTSVKAQRAEPTSPKARTLKNKLSADLAARVPC